jgi:hypothetical protein
MVSDSGMGSSWIVLRPGGCGSAGLLTRGAEDDDIIDPNDVASDSD